MSESSLDRVRKDLDAIRHVIGVDLPFGRADVVANLWLFPCGLLMAMWPWVLGWEYRKMALAPLLLALLGCLWCSYNAHRYRSIRPSAWREHKLGLLSALVMLACVMPYAQWERHVGVPRGSVGAALMFSIGVGGLLMCVIDWRRRYYVGWAIPLMVFGVVLPLLTPAHVISAAGASMATAGFLTASIQAWQLRGGAEFHATH